EHCIGCWSCLAACPYGAISQETRVDKPVVYKCDLCEDWGEPACVKVCPNEALILVEE
ncbi:MAG: 4Fe-4S binding protein, partial [Chloroflexi bacterium]|nr:4Fe-4S binding protein [Chloroflexota bacterium]